VDAAFSGTGAGVSGCTQQDGDKRGVRAQAEHEAGAHTMPYPASGSRHSEQVCDSSNAVTLPQATLHVEDLKLSLAATSDVRASGASSSADLAGHSEADGLSSGEHRNAFTLPAMGSQDHGGAADMGAAQFTHDDAPHASELTSAKHALNDDERNTLRNQVHRNFRLVSRHYPHYRTPADSILCRVYDMPPAARAVGCDCRVCEAGGHM
jgi:hypothetical protein